METPVNKTTATLLQLSAYAQYFFPLGNFIFPVLIWSVKKNDSKFVDYNGKQAINFQLSLLIYTIVLFAIAIPVFVYNLFNIAKFNYVNSCHWVIEQFNTGSITNMALVGIMAAFLFIVMKVAEFFLILYAAVKNTNGENFNYPLTIKFIK
ncbi:DUF4870 domain-containing protein [Flavobacterium sp. Sd200]|uniref:DUF4870 domain-containing protein n=1 Tax=Flavobacterium sp. Sd200 TaxID=2692211 RepID=UPI00136F075E|nr:DUF4870 domain-containing protein [Flavobacterium sp. Sd200]MXN92366.1 DUF4870 domain-containing protein [Flavobacterium sp. Sd200]